ncbi:hypothetical protein ACIO1C_06890 [Streptomyces sp. NPDC087420]|uniref:hypothetical protein n=1 Tax=Streptomyces sp. NPDC087420 TaxID=3365785 RepID=UPI00383303DB
MPTVDIQAAALVGMLAAATGGEPRTTGTEAGAVRIEADLPEQLSPATRNAILAALATADRYGHTHTDDGDTVWAELDRDVAVGDRDVAVGREVEVGGEAGLETDAGLDREAREAGLDREADL